MGPLLGSLLASGFYHLLCYVRWENINPGQDYNEWETKARKDSMVPSDRTMTDPAFNGVGNGTANGNYTNHGDTTSGFVRPPTSETAPEQQV